MTKYRRVGNTLIDMTDDTDVTTWPYLEMGSTTSKIDANKFMLGAIMDYRDDSDVVWCNVHVLAGDRLGDPPGLWGAIANKSKEEFAAIFCSPTPIHRLGREMSDRVWQVANDITHRYGGDARRIWARRSAGIIMDRLEGLGMGPATIRLILGAIIELDPVRGDLKPDSKVKRVLGRVFDGNSSISDARALEIADMIIPGNSWILYGPLYDICVDNCKVAKPWCSECPLARNCSYYNSR